MTDEETQVRNCDFHFVISAPRSGSTWLANALNHHPEIVATENRLFGMFGDMWMGPNGKKSPRITADKYLRTLSNHSFFQELGFDSAADMQTELLGEYLAFLANFVRRRSGKAILVDKITPYLGTADRVVKQIRQHFPSAKIVQLIRDGRDVAVSGVFDWIARDSQSSDRYRLFAGNDSSVTLKRFFDDEVLEKWVTYWIESIDCVANVSNVIQVRYESMLQNQAESLVSVFQHLNVASELSIAKKCAEAVTFEKSTGRTAGTEQPLAKTRKGIAGDWQNFFTRSDATLFQKLTGDRLQKLGYEEDKSWIERCPVELDLRSSSSDLK